jgi:FkbM family methyltransferase
MKRFDVLEVALIVLFALVVGAAVDRWIVTRDVDQGLRERFGRPQWSHGLEELIVRDFFNDRRGGVFVDVGAADARSGSNTYVLESELGWSGIAIDAMAEHADSYRQYRPNTQFFSFFVGDQSDRTATLWVGDRHREAASADKDFTEAHAGTDLAKREVPTITLNDLLPRAGISRIDFLSMDIEMSEPAALAGFDLARYRPALICIERHNPLRQWLVDYFSARSYVVQAKYLFADPENYWFAPAPAPIPPAGGS